MDDQQAGNADGELGMPCFVAEAVHAQQRTQTAADSGNGHQRGLRNPPEIISGFVFINKHKKKAGRIYYKQVDGQRFHKYFPFWRESYEKDLLIAGMCTVSDTE